MISEELLARFRYEMSDEADPFLWDDTSVYGYMDEAQKQFCRLTDGISDASSDICHIDVPTSTIWLELDPHILKIRSATRTSDGCKVECINVEDMPTRGLRFEPGKTGPLRLLVVGMEEDRARSIDAVSIADGLDLVIFRLPLDDIEGAGQALEVKPEHHPFLLHWMKSRAYLKQDAETFDKTRADDFEAKFRAYCFAVQREQQNKRHKGARMVAYGGL